MVLNAEFGAVDAGRIAAATSALSLLEVLVVPYRAGDLGRPILRAAAQLRARHRGLRAPDALQLATALEVRATAFVTNDRDLPSIPGLAIIQLDDHLDGN